MTKSEYITTNYPELDSDGRLAMYRKMMTAECESQITQQGELNGLEDYEIEMAHEFFDKAVRRGLNHYQAMNDIIDMMLDNAY